MTAPQGAFETMGASAGSLPLWRLHLARLARTARHLELPWAPPGDLREKACERLSSDGLPDGILRLTLRADGGFELTTRPRRTQGGPVRLQLVAVARTEDDALARIKSNDRSFYTGPLATALAALADDALLIDAHGRLLETTTCNVFVELDGGDLITPPVDAPILPGVARALVLERLAHTGRTVREEHLSVRDLDRLTGIWVTNAVYGPRQAALSGYPTPSTRNPLSEPWAVGLDEASSLR